MKSKWFYLKERSIQARLNGKSLREIEKEYGVPKSTLSGWFKDLRLKERLKNKLRRQWLEGLVKARKKAIVWHNSQKDIRLKFAEEKAINVLSKLKPISGEMLELALSMLYLGEGLKTGNGTGIGSSDPLILKFFIKVLTDLYNVKISKIKCALHLRADQNPEKLKLFWAKELVIPLENFTRASIDLRTLGKPTFPTYHGVCVVQCGNIAIQRKLLYLSRNFCERAVSSAGRAPT